MEAVLGLGASHEDQLLHALADEDWRIRRAALQRLPRSSRSAAAAAPFVGDLNPLLSGAAADALARMGKDAALPLVHVLPGNRAVQYHAPRIFDAIGRDGAASVATLVALLKDPDVNVRECAARCLTGIGKGARGASPALVQALADPRLSVVSHAALALGRIGITPELERALQDPRARVRAYAAFAYGWACGDARGLDQVPFEVRLPVLDCGDAPKGRFPALRSKDPEIAIPCAAAREAEELDAWESERVMELLLCGGCRPGAPGRFDDWRDILGSAELPAQMQYLVRARRAGGKEGVFGENHRIARHENIPALLWFARTEDDDALNGVSEVYQPLYCTADPSLFVRDERGLRGPGIPPALREWLEGNGDPRIAGLWWLDDVTPLDSDGEDLIAFARRAFGREGNEYYRAAAVRALGKLHDPESERLLREVAAREGRPTDAHLDQGMDLIAKASLARRRDPGALRDLLEKDSFAQLLEAAPGLAVAQLRARLLDPDRADETCEILEGELDESFYGARIEETLFAGIAEAAAASDLNSHALARIAVAVPGCRRAALAAAALDRLDPKAWLPAAEEGEEEHADVQPDLEAAAFLHSADPERFVATLRRWSDDPDEKVRTLALLMLLQIGDPPSAGKLIGMVGASQDYEDLARTRSPEVEQFLVAETEAGKAGASEGLFAYLGFRWLAPEGAAATVARARGGQAIPDMLAALEDREQHTVDPELGLVHDPRVLGWLKRQRHERRFEQSSVLCALVLAGDRDAKEELWSMIRCGRHRLLYNAFDERVFTLDWDFATLPHWIEELDSNCCRVAGGLESLFEEKLGGSWLHDRPGSGLGEPRSRRARTELLRRGGRFVWSPLVDHFVAAPD
jgi:HEAT repeat protein